ncbi:hypothetical protein BC629DRAFT_1596564 [Irpex lacteus]|nr:hypothetical protein BC629DRAFT_1596564 [Irpex lacteus]
MRDGDSNVALRPTKENVLREIANLVRDVKSGDRRVFYFAGHCYQVVNHRGTEIDDLDEVILMDGDCDPTPLCSEDAGKYLDFSKIGPKERQTILDGIIIDNELRRYLIDPIPVGAKLVAISDTCNSGTLFDLDYHWQDEVSSLSPIGEFRVDDSTTILRRFCFRFCRGVPGSW